MNIYKILKFSDNLDEKPTFEDEEEDGTTAMHREIAKGYETNNIVFRFLNKFTIKKLMTEEDTETERQIIEVSHNPGEKEDFRIEIYSLRNPDNIPIANVVVKTQKNSPSFFGILEVNYLEEVDENRKASKAMLKTWLAFLRKLNLEPMWIETNYDQTIEDITDLDENTIDDLGLPLKQNVGDDPDSYFKTLTDIFAKAIGRRVYIRRIAEELVDVLIKYARGRKELPILFQAAEKTEEWANNNWDNDSCNYMGDVPYPEEPSKDDFWATEQKIPGQLEFKGKDWKKTVKPFFRQKEYDEAWEEWNKKHEEYCEEESARREDYEPTQFADMVYREVQAAITKAGIKIE